MLVLVERCGIGHFVGHAIDDDRHPEPFQRFHELAIESRHRLRFKLGPADGAVARLNDQLVLDEVEVYLKRPIAMRNR